MSKIFRVCHTDDYGRPNGCMGVFRAIDRQEARKIASEYFKQPEIVTTGFYDAWEVTLEQLSKEYNSAVEEIFRQTKIIN